MDTPRLHSIPAVIALSCTLLHHAAHGGTTTPSVPATQRQRLGIVVGDVSHADGSWHAYPAEIVVPPAQQRVVAAPAAGLIDTLSVSVGDTVKPGQNLGRLRSTQTQELQRDVLQTSSQLDLAQRQLARDEALFEEGLIAQARLDATRSQWQQAKAMADERRSALRAAGGGAPAAPDGTVSMTAPIRGHVLEQLAQVGQRVEAMTPIYRIASLTPLWVELQVPAREAQAIQLGDHVEVPTPARPARAPQAVVVSLGPVVDARSQSRTVRARLDEPVGFWQPGQIVQARVQTAAPPDTVRLPADALMPTSGQRQQVFVARPGDRFELVDVTLLSREGSSVTVSPLSAGSRVVIQGTAALKALLPR